MKRASWRLWILWTMLVVAALWARNPVLFATRPLIGLEDLAKAWLFPVPLAPERRSEDGSVLSVFRSDAERSGRAELTSLASRPRRLWRIADFNQGVHGAAKASPALDASGVYLGSDAGLFVKYSWEGNPLWSWMVGKSERGIHSTAVVFGELVVFGAYNGRLYALERGTGRPAWILPAAGAVGASPLVLPGGDLQVNVETTTSRNGFALRLDGRTGAVRWRGPDLLEQTHSSSVFAAASGLLIFGSNRGELFALDVETGQPRWRRSLGAEIKSTPALVRGLACFTTWGAELRCVHIETGADADRWELSEASQGSAAVDADLGVLYVLDGGGVIGAFQPGGAKPLWRRKVAGRGQLSSPLLLRSGARRLLVTACRETEWCLLDAASGRELFASSGGGRLTASPVVFGDRLVLNFDFPGGIEAWDLSSR